MPRGADESEAETRRLRIDPKLAAADWNVVPFDPQVEPTSLTRHAVTEYPTVNGPADYALWIDGRLVGVIEAKRIGLAPQEVLVQAERYARGLTETGFDSRGYGVPFLYSTNGEAVWFHDVRHKLNSSRRLAGFHTGSALREMLEQTQALEEAANGPDLNERPQQLNLGPE